ncbi:hypothetical protein BCR41DRAFT_388842 [Lobosporangium transversale]|uniref:Uncharacterized protein n=1 Tax=Lobosporangium transversale TaxID=64571 RepID=A0A1Y2GEP3_9FUNG|nr:hypothetical protein BCR41DRAFT_388842 [Lobosporangium transversale]ORZ07786.1 hypothetical protein BCR41DRAFT_388842 [Lobosporangium transversale]|eukprot:XP_021878152.1 hypothetical protein BCR41DRAFT_388842 [Lobosporangium transversale]
MKRWNIGYATQTRILTTLVASEQKLGLSGPMHLGDREITNGAKYWHSDNALGCGISGDLVANFHFTLFALQGKSPSSIHPDVKKLSIIWLMTKKQCCFLSRIFLPKTEAEFSKRRVVQPQIRSVSWVWTVVTQIVLLQEEVSRQKIKIKCYGATLESDSFRLKVVCKKRTIFTGPDLYKHDLWTKLVVVMSESHIPSTLFFAYLLRRVSSFDYTSCCRAMASLYPSKPQVQRVSRAN